MTPKTIRDLQISVRDASHLGNALRRFRKRDGLTQRILGDKAGIEQKRVSSVESGAPGTRLETLLDLLAALDLEIVIRKRQSNPFWGLGPFGNEGDD